MGGVGGWSIGGVASCRLTECCGVGPEVGGVVGWSGGGVAGS